jgi:hypothetical protein
MKTSSHLGQGGLQGGFGAVTENLVWVVDPETHPALRDRCRVGEGLSSLHPLRRRGFSREEPV